MGSTTQHMRHPHYNLQGCRVCLQLRGCHENAQRKLLPWNLAFIMPAVSSTDQTDCERGLSQTMCAFTGLDPLTRNSHAEMQMTPDHRCLSCLLTPR